MSRAARVDGAARSADGGNDGVGGGADILCDAVGLGRVGSEHVGRAARGGALAVAVVCTACTVALLAALITLVVTDVVV